MKLSILSIKYSVSQSAEVKIYLCTLEQATTCLHLRSSSGIGG
ncbi:MULTISPECIES: hypothetical protein [unclassified Nodularia (in: cyanobacteria)]|nr:hypothetical protein [Nodularia sp. LEGE 04288]